MSSVSLVSDSSNSAFFNSKLLFFSTVGDESLALLSLSISASRSFSLDGYLLPFSLSESFVGEVRMLDLVGGPNRERVNFDP